MTWSKEDHFVFYCHSRIGFIYLVVYIDNIVLTGINYDDILQIKQHLCHHF